MVSLRCQCVLATFEEDASLFTCNSDEDGAPLDEIFPKWNECDFILSQIRAELESLVVHGRESMPGRLPSSTKKAEKETFSAKRDTDK